MSSLRENISLGIFTVIILFITVGKNIVLLSFRYVVDYNMLNLISFSLSLRWCEFYMTATSSGVLFGHLCVFLDVLQHLI